MPQSGVYVHMDARTWSKGQVKRTPQQEAALRVRIMDGLHILDALERIQAELGRDVAATIGPTDLKRNPLRSHVDRMAKAYMIPPAVDGLPEGLAEAFGDMNARTTVARYATIGSRPMPHRLLTASRENLRYRLAANWCGTLIGFSERSARPFLEVITPDDLEVEYLSDDPLSPTVIRHWRSRRVGDEWMNVRDVYDLTDLEAPSFRILRDGDEEDDVTAQVLGDGWPGWDPKWRYADDRAFHRIVIAGDPRHPYRGIELAEGTLGTIALQTHWRAGVRDAAYPQRSAIGLTLVGMDSDETTGQTGLGTGPSRVLQWEHVNEDKPGSLHQFAPGFDPEAIGRAIRSDVLDLVASMGLPVDYERTGGAPTDTEQRILDEVIASTYPECRGHDSLVLRRAAAIVNRGTAELVSEGRPDVEATSYPERAYGVLYREEVREALERVETRPPPAPRPPREQVPRDEEMTP